ncbi:MAG: dihydropteroate synthase, partial [Actinomycetales bacterium]|nr:dihydropteroate synthase [Actinomycetales bacterium]
MAFQRPQVMGVVNVTPDSFSDGGKYTDAKIAIDHARQLFAEGATILDIGGESTRPGAERVSVTEETARVVPVISGIRSSDWYLEAAVAGTAPMISIDTMNHETALAAVEAGADIVNDVSGGLADPKMFSAIAPTNAQLIISHWRGHSTEMDKLNQYEDVATDV